MSFLSPYTRVYKQGKESEMSLKEMAVSLLVAVAIIIFVWYSNKCLC